MLDSLSRGLVIVGALIMVAAGVLTNIVVVRYLLARPSTSRDRATDRSAAFVFGSSLMVCGAIGFGGACLLVLGLIDGNGTAAWTIVIPAIPLVGTAAGALYFRRQSR